MPQFSIWKYFNKMDFLSITWTFFQSHSCRRIEGAQKKKTCSNVSCELDNGTQCFVVCLAPQNLLQVLTLSVLDPQLYDRCMFVIGLDKSHILNNFSYISLQLFFPFYLLFISVILGLIDKSVFLC